VGWTADAPALQGESLRVPMPGRTLPREQAQQARGFATASRCACGNHNPGCTAAMPPRAERAGLLRRGRSRRYEALAENNYAGIRDNLAA